MIAGVIRIGSASRPNNESVLFDMSVTHCRPLVDPMRVGVSSVSGAKPQIAQPPPGAVRALSAEKLTVKAPLLTEVKLVKFGVVIGSNVVAAMPATSGVVIGKRRGGAAIATAIVAADVSIAKVISVPRRLDGND